MKFEIQLFYQLQTNVRTIDGKHISNKSHNTNYIHGLQL